MAKILVAPNAFKGSLSSIEAAQIICNAFEEVGHEVISIPITDGGDSFVDVVSQVKNGELHFSPTLDALGNKIKAKWASIDGNIAVIGVSEASGLALIQHKALQPLEANTYGTGILIRNAIESGHHQIYLGLGGSASTDGAMGILAALGAKFYDKQGDLILEFGGVHWNQVAELDTTEMDQLLQGVKIKLICDVTNPLLGTYGSAQIFAPQKGAKEQDVILLEQSLNQMNELLKQIKNIDTSSMKGGGASGGIAAALYGFCQAELKEGSPFVFELLNIEETLNKVDYLITAEGIIDDQTIQGKGCGYVAQCAKKYHVKTIGIAGAVKFEDREMMNDFSALFSISNEPMKLKDSILHSRKNLYFTASELAKIIV